jgi:hypothetical protein
LLWWKGVPVSKAYLGKRNSGFYDCFREGRGARYRRTLLLKPSVSFTLRHSMERLHFGIVF